LELEWEEPEIPGTEPIVRPFDPDKVLGFLRNPKPIEFKEPKELWRLKCYAIGRSPREAEFVPQHIAFPLKSYWSSAVCQSRIVQDER
jgi:hypothetical protein